MAFAIGLRAYRISVSVDGKVGDIKFGTASNEFDFNKYISGFIGQQTQALDNAEQQRSWFLEKKQSNEVDIKGLVRYGTYGFESRLLDKTTKSESYRRKVSDIEEIPLFFQFRVPEKSNFCLACFQSFQTRSCIQLIFDAMSKYLKKQNPSLRIHFKKLMPENLKGGALFSSGVKKITLVKKSLPRDKADAYLHNIKPEYVNMEVNIKAKRNGILGKLSDFVNFSDSVAGTAVAMLDGVQFDEARADILLGKRRRTVNVFGYSSDSGVIDISEDVARGSDGHPEFVSIAKEASEILDDFYDVLKGDVQ